MVQSAGIADVIIGNDFIAVFVSVDWTAVVVIVVVVALLVVLLFLLLLHLLHLHHLPFSLLVLLLLPQDSSG